MTKVTKARARKILKKYANATSGTFGAGVRSHVSLMAKTKSRKIKVK